VSGSARYEYILDGLFWILQILWPIYQDTNSVIIILEKESDIYAACSDCAIMNAMDERKVNMIVYVVA